MMTSCHGSGHYDEDEEEEKGRRGQIPCPAGSPRKLAGWEAAFTYPSPLHRA